MTPRPSSKPVRLDKIEGRNVELPPEIARRLPEARRQLTQRLVADRPQRQARMRHRHEARTA